MALNRRAANRFSANIWPGFVDAMTALLLVLMFVLTIFMVVQFVLRETITGQDQELNNLTAELAGLSEALGLEQLRSSGLQGNVEQLTSTLAQAQTEAERQAVAIAQLNAANDDQAARIAALSGEAADQQARIASFEQQVASLLAQNSDLSGTLADVRNRVAVLTDQGNDLTERNAAMAEELEAEQAANQALLADKDALERANLQVISEKDALQLALAQARDEIDEGTQAARLAAAKSEALEAMIADLRTDAQVSKDALNDALAALLQSQTSLETTQGDLATAQGALSDTQGSLGDTQGALSETQDQLKAARAELDAVRADLNTSIGQLGSAEGELVATRETLADIRAQLATAEARVAVLESEVTDRTGNLASAEGDLARTQAALEQAQAELFDAREALKQRGLTEAQLKERIEKLMAGLTEAEKSRLAEAAAAAALKERLKGAQDELTAMTLSLEAQRKKAEDTLTLLAAAELARDEALGEADGVLSEADKRTALLAVAQKKLRDEQALSAQSQRKVALLNQQTTDLRNELDELQGLLDAAVEADTAAKVRIESLGANLNTALARAAAEQKKRANALEKVAELEEAERKRLEAEAMDLKKFRSEFFGRLRDVLGSREGVRIVGDRFVFSSEILFDAGSADLGVRGKEEIAKVASIILDVADQIPPEINWILRVDGHTDRVPLSGRGEFVDNWELSQARALSVVKYLISDLGVPPNRLAANGFGEFQPIVDGSSVEALALNRRIELKFTGK